MFDSPRKIRIQQKRYRQSKQKKRAKPSEDTLQDCFTQFQSSRSRFREQLLLAANFAALTETPVRSIRDVILRFILDDHLDIMFDFREALDTIDEYMANDLVLRSSLQDWRSLLGQWKKTSSNDISSIAYVAEALLQEPDLDTKRAVSSGDTNRLMRNKSIVRPPLQAEFDKLALEVKGLTERVGATFQAIMATMAIVESQKAIAQAETISKLTNLAFFFIPLTLSASIFGMNIIVCISTRICDECGSC